MSNARDFYLFLIRWLKRKQALRGRYLVVGFAGGNIPKIPLNLALLEDSAIVGVFWGLFTQKEAVLSQKNRQEVATWVV